MRLKYSQPDGGIVVVPLTDKPMTFGRSHENDIVLNDEKVSRIHCGIRLWDGEYYLKDLKSRNGTFVNGETIDVARLKPGDHIRIGSTFFTFETGSQVGTETIIQETEQEIAAGKGYSTILREIVQDIDEPNARSATVPIPKTTRVRKTKP